MRLVLTETMRMDYFAKVRANIADVDLFAALTDEPELKSYVPKR